MEGHPPRVDLGRCQVTATVVLVSGPMIALVDRESAGRPATSVTMHAARTDSSTRRSRLGASSCSAAMPSWRPCVRETETGRDCG